MNIIGKELDAGIATTWMHQTIQSQMEDMRGYV